MRRTMQRRPDVPGTPCTRPHRVGYGSMMQDWSGRGRCLKSRISTSPGIADPHRFAAWLVDPTAGLPCRRRQGLSDILARRPVPVAVVPDPTTWLPIHRLGRGIGGRWDGLHKRRRGSRRCGTGRCCNNIATEQHHSCNGRGKSSQHSLPPCVYSWIHQARSRATAASFI